MEPPAPKTVATVLVAGLIASVGALLVIELVDLVISRIAHYQSKSIDTEVWNYYAVRDATDRFLRDLYATAGNTNGDRLTEPHSRDFSDAGGTFPSDS